MTTTAFGHDNRGRGIATTGPLGTGQTFEYGIGNEVDRAMVNSPMIDTTVTDRNRIGELALIVEPWGGQW